MRVLLLTFGTQGDVMPFVALGQQLLAAGHEVTLAAPSRYASLVGAAGVNFGPIDDGPLAQLDLGATIGAVSDNGFAAKARLARQLPAMFSIVFQDAWRVADELAPDVVVHNGQVLAGPTIAERLGVPAVLGLPLPMYVPTREFAWLGVDLPWLPDWANRASYVGMKANMLAFAGALDRFRTGLGLARRPHRHDPLLAADGSHTLTLHAISPAVLPRPSDWPDEAVVTGYWFPNAAQALADDVQHFLADGSTPVYLGFGSMAGRDPGATAAAVLEALGRLGLRAVISRGWGGVELASDNPDVLVVDQVPHELLLPRVRAAVHHGGAGTVAGAVRAGVPQVVCPYVADQPFWAHRMQALGVAPDPLPQRALTADALIERLGTVLTEPSYAARAAALGVRVRAEDGRAEAVKLIERVVA